jgi:hypothetical protein
MPTTTITKRTTVGFGYNASVEQCWNSSQTQSWLQVCDVDEPTYTGTVKTVKKQLNGDRELRSYYNNGTFYRTAWFIKVRGEWRKVTDQWFSQKIDDLYNDGPMPTTSVTVEIES